MRRAAEIVLIVLGFLASVALFLGVFIAAVDPYGVNTFGIAVLGKDVPRAGRAERDRIIRPLDVAAQQPRTIFLGTSRTKQALNPTLLADTPLAPAYNAGIDKASLSETRAMLQDAIREDRNLRYVFIELNPGQFFVGGEKTANVQTLMSAWPWLLTTDAIATARDTLADAIHGRTIKFSVRPDGLQANLPAPSNPSRWAYEFFQFWRARDLSVKQELSPLMFGQINQMRADCEAAQIRCEFYTVPMSPPVMAAFYLDQSLDVFIEWKRRLAAFGGVVDFSYPGTLFWETGQGATRLTYWKDTGHYSLEGGKLLVNSLLHYVETGSLESAVMLTETEVDRQAVVWPQVIAAYLDSDPSLAASYLGK